MIARTAVRSSQIGAAVASDAGVTAADRTVLPLKRGLFAVIAGVILFLYFEVQWQIWFLNLLDGYLVKVWVPPLALFLWALMSKQKVNLRIGQFSLWSLALYSIFSLTSLWANETPYFAFKWYLIMIAPVWIFVAILTKFRTNKDIERFLAVLFVCSLAQTAYSVYSFTAWVSAGQQLRPIIVTNKGNEMGGGEGAALVVSRRMEASARFGDLSFEQGKFAALIFPALVLGIYYGVRVRGWRRYACFATAIGLSYATVATVSRSAVIAATLALGLLLWYLIRLRFAKKSILLLIAPAIFFVLVLNLPTLLRVLQAAIYFDSVAQMPFVQEQVGNYEVIVWEDAHITSLDGSLAEFRTNPLLGTGYSRILGMDPEHGSEHNRFLFILASTGILTAVPYIAFIGGILWTNWRGIQKARRGPPRDLGLGVVLLACNWMFVIKLNNEGMETIYYWVFFALAAAWSRNCERDRLRQASKGFAGAQSNRFGRPLLPVPNLGHAAFRSSSH